MPAQPRKAKKYGQKSWMREFVVDLEVPSGELCQVRRPGITGLIKTGILESLDSLTSLVQTEHIDRVEKGSATTISKEQVKDLLKDVRKLDDAMTLLDKVICYVVVQPKVIRPIRVDEQGKPVLDEEGREIGLTDDEREAGVVYCDMIDLEDKVYIFQYAVGGVSDLETFRKEFRESLGSLESIPGIQL